jgi:hypothetical protein
MLPLRPWRQLLTFKTSGLRFTSLSARLKKVPLDLHRFPSLLNHSSKVAPSTVPATSIPSSAASFMGIQFRSQNWRSIYPLNGGSSISAASSLELHQSPFERNRPFIPAQGRCDIRLQQLLHPHQRQLLFSKLCALGGGHRNRRQLRHSCQPQQIHCQQRRQSSGGAGDLCPAEPS